jgi:hypothetical protein
LQTTGGYRDHSSSPGWDASYDQTQRIAAPGDRPPGRGPAINISRLWAGGVATGIVAALIGFVGLLIVRVLLQIPYLAPIRSGALGDSRTVILCLSAFVSALAATGLAHLLMLSTPRPMAYFGWIAGLLTTIAVTASPRVDSECVRGEARTASTNTSARAELVISSRLAVSRRRRRASAS